MTATALPPIGSVWIHRSDPHDIAIVTGYNMIQLKHVGQKNNVIKIHKDETNTETIEIINTFTWKYKPLENK